MKLIPSKIVIYTTVFLINGNGWILWQQSYKTDVHGIIWAWVLLVGSIIGGVYWKWKDDEWEAKRNECFDGSE